MEELLEQLQEKGQYLDKIDKEVGDVIKTDDFEEQVSRVLEYKEHTALRKTELGRAIRRAQGDGASEMSFDSDPMRKNVKLSKLVI